MLSVIYRPLLALALAGALFPRSGFAQSSPAPQVEPGLEKAVRWKWQVEPSPAQDWGLALPATAVQPLTLTPAQQAAIPANTAIRPTTYIVKRGDALVLIAKRFHTGVPQLKQANGLTSDTIRVGQELVLPPPLPSPTPGPRAPGAKTPAKTEDDLATLTLQVFLDREGFSSGPINAQRSPTLDRVQQLYQSVHPDVADPAALARKAQAALPEPLATYTLRVEDFRFIAPPKAEHAVATPTPSGKHKPAAPRPTPPPKYADMVSVSMLAYRSPWEFVAERFHCNEKYLRALNPQLPPLPAAGAEFRVPNVIPFAIERAFVPPLQPAASPAEPVTAAITNYSMLEISRGGRLIAAMPLAIARPGLRGKGSWTVLQAIPRPRLVTNHEPLVKVEAPQRLFGRETPTPTPAPTPAPPPDTLAAGPRNPVGIFWIDLAKAGSTEPLPYGLHGTSSPDRMNAQQSLGGLRLTNWDIARAVRLLPVGTPLEWRQPGLMPPPVAAPAAVAQPAH
jgi:LysM repeat protein